jgi:hypothetical protein
MVEMAGDRPLSASHGAAPAWSSRPNADGISNFPTIARRSGGSSSWKGGGYPGRKNRDQMRTMSSVMIARTIRAKGHGKNFSFNTVRTDITGLPACPEMDAFPLIRQPRAAFQEILVLRATHQQLGFSLKNDWIYPVFQRASDMHQLRNVEMTA